MWPSPYLQKNVVMHAREKNNFRLIYANKADGNPHKKHKIIEQLWIFRVDLILVVRFRKCVLPEGLAKEPPTVLKITEWLDLIGYTMVSTISICNFVAKTTTDAFKQVPEPFQRFLHHQLGTLMKLYMYNGG